MTVRCFLLAGALLLGMAASHPAQIMSHVSVGLPVSEPRDMTGGDFDADGFTDLVLVDDRGDVWLVRTLAAGRPDVPVRVGAGIASSAWIRSSDLDGDGDLDLVMGGRRAPAQPITLPTPLFPLPPLPPAPFDRLLAGINDGMASFTWSYQQLPFYGTGIDARLGRANADAFPDLFLLTPTGITVLLNDGAGNLLHHADFPKTDPALFPSAGPGAIVADVTNHLDVADFDGDGFDDVAVVNNRIRVVDLTQLPFIQQVIVDKVTIHRSDGQGNLSLGPQVPTGSDARHLIARDFDGDSLADFAILLPGRAPIGGATADPGGIQLFRNTGSGSFAATSLPSGTTPWQLVAGDFDGTMGVDLATIGYNQFLTGLPPAGFQVELTAHAGDGMGGFAPGLVLGRATAWLGPVTADFDGDGSDDLAALSWSNGFAQLRFMCSSPRGFPIEPGTGDDLVIATSVDGGPLTSAPPDDVKTIGPGGPMLAEASSPNGTFAGAPLYAFIGFGLFEWAANPTPGTFQILAFPFWDIIALPPLPASGSVPLSANAPALIGFNFYVQFAVASTAASNGAYATTDAHFLQVR